MPTWQFLDKLELKVWKRNTLMQILCQYMKLHYEILFSFQYYISRPTSLNHLEITPPLFFLTCLWAQTTKHFQSNRICFLILQTTVNKERTWEKKWSNFLLSSSSLTPVSHIKDRQRRLFMALTDFSSITDGDVAVEWLKLFTLWHKE